jgi:hypothetical protein
MTIETRVDKLEGKMETVENCIIRLEEGEKTAIKHRDDVEKALWKNGKKALVPSIQRIEQKLDDQGKRGVTWVDIAKTFLIPALMIAAGYLISQI